MSSPTPRSVTPIIRWIRNFMAARNVKDHQRFEHLYSPRNQPPPSIPGGIAHNLSHNYYHTRDGRRSVNPPTNSYSSAKLISANSKKPIESGSRTPRPGTVYNWD